MNSSFCYAKIAIIAIWWTMEIRGEAMEVPPLTDGAPAAGQRVRVVAPEYEGSGVYHTLYLPLDWQPNGSYPVIVEYAPNRYSNGGDVFSGSVEDTQLGYFQSGGSGFIWVSMPFINGTTDPPREATTWWGNGNVVDPQGEARSAEYTAVNLRRILEQYSGDPASVFVTGFSRGAIANGYIALRDDTMADIWLGFLPHSHHDGGTFTPDPQRTRLSRIASRPSFITYGQANLDGGAANSRIGAQILSELGFPYSQFELSGVGHTDAWIEDDASPSSLQVRQQLRDWLATVVRDKPGTHSISGHVTDAAGQPLPDVLIESGLTHFTYTNELGAYSLSGLIDGPRTLTARRGDMNFLDNARTVQLRGEDLTVENFIVTSVPEPRHSYLSWILLLFTLWCRRPA